MLGTRFTCEYAPLPLPPWPAKVRVPPSPWPGGARGTMLGPRHCYYTYSVVPLGPNPTPVSSLHSLVNYVPTRFSLAEILVLAGSTGAGRMAPPASTRMLGWNYVFRNTFHA